MLEFVRLLATYDRANVIGTKDQDQIMLSHVLDSLSCFLHEPINHARRIADVGSGGGLPGIPIKIMRPELTTTLVESTSKKARFLQFVVESLSLEGTEVANKRAEDLARMQAHRGSYDVVTSRAVSRLSVVAEYSIPLLKIGGFAVSMKSRLEPEELAEGGRAAESLGARVAEIVPVPMLPEIGEKERNLIILEKLRDTPAQYPRRSGTAAKKPLGTA
ncbi:MAG TPA: 16S rRNA (guanine(527)-N(7))-methyltransferase RsmG [Rubrobacter sp.]|nr:16S rRNA (guanine(527)-N(7))-methyltransferase RsmG [Rubrobacter sp.]